MTSKIDRQRPRRNKHTCNLLRIGPGRMGPNLKDGRGSLKIRNVVRVQFFRRYRKPGVDAIASLMRPNGVPLSRVADGGNDRPADLRVGVTPQHRYRVDPKGIGMGGDRDVVHLGELRLWNAPT